MLISSSYPFLAEQYLDLLAIEWKRRQAALGSHAMAFPELIALDGRITTCSRALDLLAPVAKEMVNSRLNETIMSGEMFAIMLFALRTQDKQLQAACFGLAQSIPKLRAPFASALAWVPTPIFNQSLAGLNRGNSTLHAMVLDACIAHSDEIDPGLRKYWAEQASAVEADGAVLHYAIHSSNVPVPAGAVDLLGGEQSKVRCSAADAILAKKLRQEARHAIDTLHPIAISKDATSLDALEILACHSVEAITPVLQHLANDSGQTRAYIQALALSGIASNIPELIEYLDHPQHSRIAAAGLSMVTGSLPARDGWIGAPRDPVYVEPDAGPEIPAKDPDANLPTADKAAFVKWWERNAAKFSHKTRVLGGLPETPENLIHILDTGKLAWRKVAARRLDYLADTGRLHTSAPSHAQSRRIATLKEKFNVH